MNREGRHGLVLVRDLQAPLLRGFPGTAPALSAMRRAQQACTPDRRAGRLEHLVAGTNPGQSGRSRRVRFTAAPFGAAAGRALMRSTNALFVSRLTG